MSYRKESNELLKTLDEDKEYLSDKVTQVLDDYGILYGDIVENGDGTVNIVGVDEEEWYEVQQAIKSELGLEVLVPDEGHAELDDELIVLQESLKEDLESSIKDKLETLYNEGDVYFDIAHDEDGDEFLIVDGWEDVQVIQQALKPDFEPKDRYDTSVLDEIFDNGYQWGFRDEYAICDCCGKVIRTVPNSYSWLPDFFVNDKEGTICCGNCVRENPKAYLETLYNNADKANTILSEDELKAQGFEKIDGDFESGWNDKHDSPDEILDKALEEHPEGVFIFNISGQGQFATQFELWGADLDLDESLKEDVQMYVYQFPADMTEEDIKTLSNYNLELLGKVNERGFQPDDYLVRGLLKDLKKYCKEYLGYEMHPDYLYKEEEIDLDDILDESLNESMKSEVTKWWKDVEDENLAMQWGYKIDNGDYDDVEAMHAAMFDMLNELKEKDAFELFNRGKKIYNKYAKYSKYNPDSVLTTYDESLKEDDWEKTFKKIERKYVGKRAIFTYLEDYTDIEELEEYEGQPCDIIGADILDGYADGGFDSCYWSIEFDDGTVEGGIPGVALEISEIESINKSLKEDLDAFDDDFELSCKDIATALSNGWWHGQTQSGRNWGLSVNGKNENQFSPRFADVISAEVAYPVGDGVIKFYGLDLFLTRDMLDYVDFDNEKDLETLKNDLLIVNASEEDIDRFLKGEDDEIEVFIDFEIDADDVELEEDLKEDNNEMSFEQFLKDADILIVDDAKSFDINKWEEENQKEIDEELELDDSQNELKQDAKKFIKYRLDENSVKEIIKKLSESDFSIVDGRTSWKTKQFLKKKNLTFDDLKEVLRNLQVENYKTNSKPTTENEGYNEAIIFVKNTKVKDLGPFSLYIKLDYDSIEESPVVVISLHQASNNKQKVNSSLKEEVNNSYKIHVYDVDWGNFSDEDAEYELGIENTDKDYKEKIAKWKEEHLPLELSIEIKNSEDISTKNDLELAAEDEIYNKLGWYPKDYKIEVLEKPEIKIPDGFELFDGYATEVGQVGRELITKSGEHFYVTDDAEDDYGFWASVNKSDIKKGLGRYLPAHRVKFVSIELLEDFKSDMKFLADDEVEAIDGYQEIIDKVKDNHVAKQLKHIQDEEEAHLKYLNKVQDDKSANYEHE